MIAWVGEASAQAFSEPQNYSVERLRLALDRKGVVDVESGAVLSHLSYDVGLWLGYAAAPMFVTSSANGKRVGYLVEHRLSASVFGAIGLFDRVNIGLELPFTAFQSRPTVDLDIAAQGLTQLQAAALGDLRVAPKIQLLREEKHAVDLALMMSLTLPTSGGRHYSGESFLTFSPELLVSRVFDSGLVLAGNFGVTIREVKRFIDQTITHELTYRLGIGYRFKERTSLPLGVELALTGAVALARPFARANENATEVRAEVNYEFDNGLMPFLGGGVGLTGGYGTPDGRVFAGVRFGRTHEKAAAVASPTALPPPPPAQAWAPTEAPANDSLAAPEPASQVVVIALPPPNPDRDGDAIVNQEDRCPDEAGVKENGGCPDSDRDHDQVVDRLDSCPDVAGVADNDGCEALVTREDRELMVRVKVLFPTSGTEPSPEALDALKALSRYLARHPEIHKLRIVGHTDNVGDRKRNKAISEARATAVMKHLIVTGIDAVRLEAHGEGPDKPISSNDSERGRAANRRVQLLIVE